MPKFLCMHTVPPKGVTMEQVKQISQMSQTSKGAKGVRSFGSLTEGKMGCIFEAASKQDVVNFFASAKMPAESIIQMDFEGECGNVVKL
jgi:Protein of unknown function (DUF4242)